ncbi:MAG: DUF3800 domain-containing protein [Methanobrevibacter thaueri]|uniref:DUF3800 domain-containing protein n=1 Tax=Methanobrevibacter thaueri TaxID=190975 RepID=UPI0026EE4737|nr:DUF3800 domain-containing protein [Methanobrevibacter thaueri]MBE6496189.1 DUF3800 domain-containing protein [Methanobrevibacter thaueri]
MSSIHFTVMKYIYIDESGDLGDSYSSSKHFVMGAIVVDSPRSLKRIIKKVKRDNRNRIHKAPEIKGNKTDKHIIEKILRKVNNLQYEVYAICLDKQNLDKIPNFYNHHALYDEIASKLAEKIKITSPTCIIVDKSKFNPDYINNFNDLFLSKLNNVENHPVSIMHGDSINYKGLQIADLISWSVFQKAEHQNAKYIDLMENKKIFGIYKN